MKKLILSLFLFLTLISTSVKPAFAQNDCSFACRVPESATCNACLNSQGQSNFEPAESSDPCSYACRGSQQAVECVRCRGGELTPLGGGNISDPMAGCASESVNTAIGCIPVGDTTSFMGWILGWAIGVGGGVAFLLIVYASFMIMTSQGMPDRLKAGQELLTSAISGLIMLIFSVFILKFIGIDILGLGDLGFGQIN